MGSERIYLDHAATTPVHPDVLAAMLPCFGYHYGNPGSSYELGKKAKALVENSRECVASLIGASPDEVIFTSGGTESNNLAIKGVAFANEAKGRRIITCATEHHSVLNSCEWLEKRGFSVSYLPVDSNGVLDPDDLKRAVTDDTILISVMHANNETGAIQPVEEIGNIAKERGVLFHIDAVQSIGKIPVDAEKTNSDLLSISSHKIYGPKGTGALYVRKGTSVLEITSGGGQEKGLRSGTENVTGIVGLGKACEAVREGLDSNIIHIKSLRDTLEHMIVERFPSVCVNAGKTPRTPNILSVSFEGLDAQSIVSALDAHGICISAGAACASGIMEPSHVLLAMRTNPGYIYGTLRFSLGWENTEEEILKTVRELEKSVSEWTEFHLNRPERLTYLSFASVSESIKAKAILNNKNFKCIFAALPSHLRSLGTSNTSLAIDTSDRTEALDILSRSKVKPLSSSDITGIDRPSFLSLLAKREVSFWKTLTKS